MIDEIVVDRVLDEKVSSERLAVNSCLDLQDYDSLKLSDWVQRLNR